MKYIKYSNPSSMEGDLLVTHSRNGTILIIDENNRQVSKYDVPYGAHLLINEGDTVEKHQVLYEWDPYNSVIVAEHTGIVNYVDLKENVRNNFV